jgi:CRISPR-associated protein Cmr2
MSSPPGEPKALLSFFLGPVQGFIESARTLRDLWTGSYLLSWLTVAAVEPVLRLVREGRAEMITPHIGDDNQMIAASLDGRRGADAAAVPCLPSKFAAIVPANEAASLAEKCVKASRREWQAVCDAVKSKLDRAFRERDRDWDRNWADQITAYFEVRCAILPLANCSAEVLGRLNVPGGDEWARQMNLLAALMDVTKSVRHVPPYRAKADGKGRYPGKCSLLGSFEQMGPADFAASRAFWAALAGRGLKDLPGTRLQKSDRLCAVSLVKRFAWPAYFAERLGLPLKALRFSDTATVAARRWLRSEPRLDPEAVRRQHGDWSGQWLHWQRRDQEEDEEPCPEEVWRAIQAKKRLQGKPPTYYAIVQMDGDHMGQLFQGERGPQGWGVGERRYREITSRLTRYALHAVRQVVETHDGELIYAGGDDVLALLPTSAAGPCPRQLRDEFRLPEHLGGEAMISAGVAVVHAKEDLRFALGQARGAERTAKSAGRDALALTVCRRSGEHTTAVLGWGQAGAFGRLVAFFQKGVSDRWSYRLRGELPTLEGEDIAWAARASELARVLGRVEGASEEFRGQVMSFLAEYHEEIIGRIPEKDKRKEEKLRKILSKAFADVVTLCQSASFLARGRD